MPTRIFRRPAKPRVPVPVQQTVAEQFWREGPSPDLFRAKRIAEPHGLQTWQVFEAAIRFIPDWKIKRLLEQAQRAQG